MTRGVITVKYIKYRLNVDTPLLNNILELPNLKKISSRSKNDITIIKDGSNYKPNFRYKEWTSLPQGSTIPPGMEIEMDVSNQSKGIRVRIPNKWRLVVYLPDRIGRVDVTRSMTIREVCDKFKGYRITVEDRELKKSYLLNDYQDCPECTVESMNLFGKRVSGHP